MIFLTKNNFKRILICDMLTNHKHITY